MKTLGVSIDGRVIGFFASPEPEQSSLLAMVGNIPRTYMRAHIMSETPTESWQWQLPDVQQGECISFGIRDAREEDVRPPQFVRRPEVEEVASLGQHSKKEAKERVSQTVKRAPASPKALEVSIDGLIVGVFVPPSGKPFVVSLCSGPDDSITANVSYPGASDESEWALPTIRAGQSVSFRMIDSPVSETGESFVIQNSN